MVFQQLSHVLKKGSSQLDEAANFLASEVALEYYIIVANTLGSARVAE